MNKVKDYKDAQAHYAKDDRGESKGAFLAFIREPSSMDQEPRPMVDERCSFLNPGMTISQVKEYVIMVKKIEYCKSTYKILITGVGRSEFLEKQN